MHVETTPGLNERVIEAQTKTIKDLARELIFKDGYIAGLKLRVDEAVEALESSRRLAAARGNDWRTMEVMLKSREADASFKDDMIATFSIQLNDAMEENKILRQNVRDLESSKAAIAKMVP